jgi:hypothetical protein
MFCAQTVPTESEKLDLLLKYQVGVSIMRNFFIGFLFLFFVSTCYAEDPITENYILITDMQGRTYKNWQIEACPGGREEELTNIDKLEIGIKPDKFVEILGTPDQEELNGDLTIFWYVISDWDCHTRTKAERENSINENIYLPDFDRLWAPFFFRDNVFVGCGPDVEKSISEKYGQNYYTHYVRFDRGLTQELFDFCGWKKKEVIKNNF